MKDKLLGRHTFCFNDKDNSGEGLFVKTEIYDNGDGLPDGIYFNQEVTLQSYSNSASFHLCSALFTPELLRKYADELELCVKSIQSN